MRQATATTEDAAQINWAQVERDVVFEIISEAECEPHEVAQVIAHHSPGSVPALRAAAVASRIEHQAAGLEHSSQTTSASLRELGLSH